MSATMTSLADVEREHILEAIHDSKGVISGPHGAATKLGMDRNVLAHRMSKLGITRQEIAEAARDSGKYFCSAGKESFRERQMVRSVTKPTWSRRNVARATYGTIDYIAKHIFRSDENMVTYARLVAEDGDSRFKTFIESWEADRSSGLPPGAHSTLSTIVKEAGINSIDFCVEVMRSCMRRNMEISNIYAGLAHPKVIQRNIKQALKPKGVKDREMFLQHSGWLPVPKGSVITVHAQAAAAAVSGTALGDKTETTPLPAFEEQTVAASKIVREEFDVEP